MHRPYDIERFLTSMVDKDYPEIMMSADRACASAENRSYGVKGAVRARNEGSVDYARSLKMFLFFMTHLVRPGGISDSEFALYKPIYEALVRKGQIKPHALALFD